MARTVTISDEAAAGVEAAAIRTKRPVDELVSEALLKHYPPQTAASAAEPFVITGPFLRERPGTNFSFDKIEALLDEVEGPFGK